MLFDFFIRFKCWFSFVKMIKNVQNMHKRIQKHLPKNVRIYKPVDKTSFAMVFVSFLSLEFLTGCVVERSLGNAQSSLFPGVSSLREACC